MASDQQADGAECWDPDGFFMSCGCWSHQGDIWYETHSKLLDGHQLFSLKANLASCLQLNMYFFFFFISHAPQKRS